MPDATNDLRLRGLALPAIRSAGGYFATKDKYDVAWGDLLLALHTPIGTRPMRRNFGSAIHLTLFQANSDAGLVVLEEDIREAIRIHCPHINVLEVDARRDQKTIQISVTFGLQGDARIQNRTQRLSATDYIQVLSAASS